MRIEEYIKMWDVDCKITEPLHQDAQRTFELHTKYYKHLMRERFALKKQELELEDLREDLDDYYQGAQTPELLEKLKMEPYQFNAIRNAEARSRKITTTPTFVEKSLAILAEREKVEFLNEIIYMLKQRQWVTKNMLESKRFDAGLS